MISRFFIDRPIFASVLSIVITLAGAIALFNLPIAQYPQIAPPTVNVTCNYPGASAQVVAETVAAPIEQQVNGVENMMYMSSQCTNDGSYSLTVTFQHGVNLNMAQVLVQNRVGLATPLLPDVIKQTGVTTKKRAPDILLVIALTSPDARYDQLYLSNYALMHVRDELARLPGVSDVNMLGQRDYSMRIWIDPEQLVSRNMTAGDIARAIREQNAQLATGQIGQPPALPGQATQAPLSTRGRLVEPEEFGQVVVKTGRGGRRVLLKDVARLELGARNQDVSTRVNGKPAASIAIFQLPDANALETADVIKDKMQELKAEFPEGVDYEIRYDTTPFIRESIQEVNKTLLEAVALVAVVVLLFLQNWRSAVIPLIAVPVGIVGTFAVMAAFGFSLNNLTLFGLVLAIGIVVDDAIVVVESVEHHIEHGMAPREATIRAMDEVSGPVIAIGLVLSSVFIPCAFISGIVGQFFRQFALTIASSTLISTFNSLTLSPALAAVLLKPREQNTAEVLPRPVFAVLGGWAGWEYLGSVLTPLLERATAHTTSMHLGAISAGPLNELAARPEAAAVLGLLAGALAGWLISRPLNAVLGGFFRLFNFGFRLGTTAYTRTVGVLLRVAALVILVYGGLLFLTYRGFVTTPTGFIPSQDMGYILCNVQLPDSASTQRSQEVLDRLETIARGLNVVRPVTFTRPDGTTETVQLGVSDVPFTPVIGARYTVPAESALEKERKEEAAIMGPGLPLKVQVKHPEGYDIVLLAPPKNKEGWEGTFQHDSEVNLEFDEGRKTLSFTMTKALAEAMAGKPVELRLGGTRGVRFTQTITGQSFLLNAFGSNFGSMFLILDPYDKRPTDDLYVTAILGKLKAKFDKLVPEAVVSLFPPPPVRGVGRAGGFMIMVEDRGDNPLPVLQAQTEALARMGNEARGPDGKPIVVNLPPVFRANVPQLDVEVNRTECLKKGVALQDFFDTLRIYLGSLYVNDFNRFGRTWQVIVQADPRFRNQVEDVKKLKVRNSRGLMVPVPALAEVREKNGPLVLTRYNMYAAAQINGSAAPGISSGQAINFTEELARTELPHDMAYEWTELAFLEKEAGNTASIVFGFSVIMVFLVLAAQYESWSLPLAIILVVPMCLLGGIAGVTYKGEDINIFTQIGFVVLVGLASKNAILIVEFAKMRRDEGASRREATLDACRLRLRPIVMTSMAFILGVIPLMVSHGAGAEMRRTLGTTVFSGMLGVTAFGLLLTPVFFFVIDWLGSSSLFNNPLIRFCNKTVLGALSLRPVRELGRSVLRRRNARSKKPGHPSDATE